MRATLAFNGLNLKRVCGKGTLCQHIFLYFVYTSIKELLNTMNCFSSFMGLKPNLSKCEVAEIGVLKGVKVAICRIKCVDLTKEAIKILGVFFL